MKKAKVAKKTVKAAKTRAAKTTRTTKTARTRREWTKADLKELKDHSKARTPVVKIAKLTKRSVGALRQKALHLGLGLGHRR